MRERDMHIGGKRAQNKVFRGKLSLHTVLHTIVHVIIVTLCFGNTILVIITKWWKHDLNSILYIWWVTITGRFLEVKQLHLPLSISSNQTHTHTIPHTKLWILFKSSEDYLSFVTFVADFFIPDYAVCPSDKSRTKAQRDMAIWATTAKITTQSATCWFLGLEDYGSLWWSLNL